MQGLGTAVLPASCQHTPSTLHHTVHSKDRPIQKPLPTGCPPSSRVDGGERKGFINMHELRHVICPWSKVKEQALAMFSVRELRCPSRLVLWEVKSKVKAWRPLLTIWVQPAWLCEQKLWKTTAADCQLTLLSHSVFPSMQKLRVCCSSSCWRYWF